MKFCRNVIFRNNTRKFNFKKVQENDKKIMEMFMMRRVDKEIKDKEVIVSIIQEADHCMVAFQIITIHI